MQLPWSESIILNIELILFTYRFYVCTFTNSLKYFYPSTSITFSAFLVIDGHSHVQSGKKFELPNSYINTHVLRSNKVLLDTSCFTSNTVNTLHPLCDILNVTRFAFLCFLFMTSMVKRVPSYLPEYHQVFLSIRNLEYTL